MLLLAITTRVIKAEKLKRHNDNNNNKAKHESERKLFLLRQNVSSYVSSRVGGWNPTVDFFCFIE